MLFLVLLINAAAALASPFELCESYVRTPLQNAESLIEKLEGAIEGQNDYTSEPHHEFGSSVTINIIERTHEGVRIGKLDYYPLRTRPNTLRIEQAYTHPDYRWTKTHPSRGVFKLLLSYAIRQFPNTKIIESVLDDRNFELFKESYDSNSHLPEYERTIFAVKTTPAYKARRTLGFGDILHVQYRGQIVELNVGLGPDSTSFTPVTKAKEVVKQLTPKIPGELNIDGSSYPHEAPRVHYTVLSLSEFSKPIGRLEFTIKASNPQLMTITLAKTEPEHRATSDHPSRGVFKLLLAHAILRNPNIKMIEGSLELDNEAAFLNARDQLAQQSPSLSPEELKAEAVKETPLYKALRDLGFIYLIKIVPQIEINRLVMGSDPIG